MNSIQQSHNLVLNRFKILLNLLDKLKIHVEPEMQSKGYIKQSCKRFERNIGNAISRQNAIKLYLREVLVFPLLYSQKLKLYERHRF